MTEQAYSLLDEPWIPCLTVDGATVEVSLLDLFHRAPDLRRVVGDLPTQGFALLRLALAVLHRAVDGPADEDAWHDLWEAGGPPVSQIEAYLRGHADRFDLFHDKTPFLQVAGLHTAKGEFFGLERLIADVPAGHRFFSTRAGRGLASISPAEAARWLVHAQAYDVSGIKSHFVGDPRGKGGKVYPLGLGWAGYLGGMAVEGETLWETLLLNLVPLSLPDLVESGPADRAAWEADPPGPEPSPDVAGRPYGPVDLLTWPSRRMLLRREGDGVTGVLIGYGDPLTPQNQHLREPMTAWRRSEAQEKKLGMPLVYMPLEHDPSRALWRGLAAILPNVAPRGRDDDKPPRVTAGVVAWAGRALERPAPVTLHAVGMVYGSNNSVVDDVVDDRLTVRLDLLADGSAAAQGMVVDAVAATDAAVLALRNLASNLVRAAGGTDARLVEGARARAAEQAYGALDQPFRSWLSTLGADSDVDAARTEWHDRARRTIDGLGQALVDAAGPAAWVGREVSGRRVTAPEAHAWFHAALLAALPRPPRTQEAPHD